MSDDIDLGTDEGRRKFREMENEAPQETEYERQMRVHLEIQKELQEATYDKKSEDDLTYYENPRNDEHLRRDLVMAMLAGPEIPVEDIPSHAEELIAYINSGTVPSVDV